MIVPFANIAKVNHELATEIKQAFDHTLASNSLIMGPELEAFEREWARYCGAGHAVGVACALDALSLLLRASGVGVGDYVVVPAHTYIATWMAVSALGAIPVPVDCGDDGRMDQAALDDMLYRTDAAAVLVTHLYGYEEDIDGIRSVIRLSGRNIPLFVDAAQAHGTLAIADGAAFSFYPTKNLGCLGDGGAVVTRDKRLAEHVRVLRNYGSSVKNDHRTLGVNSRLDEVQAAVLRVKLPSLNKWNTRRTDNADVYRKMLSKTPQVTLPPPGNTINHLYVIQHPERNRLKSALEAVGIETAVHYPIPPHLSVAYQHLGHVPGQFPGAERWADRGLSLPVGPELMLDQVKYVADAIRRLA